MCTTRVFLKKTGRLLIENGIALIYDQQKVITRDAYKTNHSIARQMLLCCVCQHHGGGLVCVCLLCLIGHIAHSLLNMFTTFHSLRLLSCYNGSSSIVQCCSSFTNANISEGQNLSTVLFITQQNTRAHTRTHSYSKWNKRTTALFSLSLFFTGEDIYSIRQCFVICCNVINWFFLSQPTEEKKIITSD